MTIESLVTELRGIESHLHQLEGAKATFRVGSPYFYEKRSFIGGTKEIRIDGLERMAVLRFITAEIEKETREKYRIEALLKKYNKKLGLAEGDK